MKNSTTCLYWSVPQLSYRDAWQLQLQHIKKIAEKQAPPTLFFLEHRPVVTIGKNGTFNHLLLSEQDLKTKGVECILVDRGGDITFHGPGQLVVYPMLSLIDYDRDVHQFLRRIENIGIKVLADYGITGRRIPESTGVWVENQKIMAIGVGVKKWITFHGLAFNFSTDLEGFQWIVPCGIKDKGVTSLHLLLKRRVARQEIEQKFIEHFQQEFEIQVFDSINPFSGMKEVV